jgi:POT family proton-dependent oligopeptide transporter
LSQDIYKPIPTEGEPERSEFEKRFHHPPGLFVLFFTEMWERFSYYGMRGLLRAYMVYFLFTTVGMTTYPTDAPDVTEGPSDPHNVWFYGIFHGIYGDGSAKDFASSLYGLYTALVYATPFFGGLLADRFIGQRRAVVIGGVVMAIGHFVMASHQMFFLALALLIIGNGFFKPNISTQVGDLYKPGDSRRDGAFTIFYMGINLGAFICNFVCATLAQLYGWHYGFGAAGVGMLFGLGVYLWGNKYLAPEKPRTAKAAAAGGESGPLSSNEWARIGALVLLFMLNISFWAVYEQQGNTLQDWADTKTIWPVIGGFQLPAAWYQSFNPGVIIFIAPLLDMFWDWQKRRGTEPSSVAKMAIGSILLGLSFLIMVQGANVIGDGKGSLLWPLLCTFILTVGELYLSPIGLSLVTKVSPARIVSMMMGMWLGSSFLGNYLAGYLGTFYDDMTKAQFFGMLSAIGIVTGLLMLTFIRPLKKIIGDV